jgi:ATP-dependent DNA helicase RecQ
MKLAEIDLHKELKKYFGFNNFKGLQEDVIESIISGHNTFVIMPTGGGKSLCYQLPALVLEGTAIVVSPLIALMKKPGGCTAKHIARGGYSPCFKLVTY